MSADFSPRPKDRLDTVLALRGLCDSREQAKRLILAGEVMVNGHAATKPGHVVKPDDMIVLKNKPRYVSRGGLKLEGALTSFNIDPTGLTCLDAGASTGGFTDCLLQHGAAKVYAFDVGTNQLVWKIRSDARVTAREQFNLRQLQPADVPEPIDLAVFDLSFISLTLILPAVMAVLHPDHGQDSIAFQRGLFTRAPVVIVVVSTASQHAKIPEWEQLMSSAAACYNMVLAATAMGFDAQWQTDWVAYDPEAMAAMGLKGTERVSGIIYIGTTTAALEDRPRPDPQALLTRWVKS